MKKMHPTALMMLRIIGAKPWMGPTRLQWVPGEFTERGADQWGRFEYSMVAEASIRAHIISLRNKGLIIAGTLGPWSSTMTPEGDRRLAEEMK